jgi:hypothetical protein
MLRAEPYAAIGVIAGAEFQAIRPALLVIDIREVAGVAAVCTGCRTAQGRTYGGRAGDGRTGDGRTGGGGAHDGGPRRRRAASARYAAATEFPTRAIGGVIASAQYGQAND